jgi:hypothetical protein
MKNCRFQPLVTHLSAAFCVVAWMPAVTLSQGVGAVPDNADMALNVLRGSEAFKGTAARLHIVQVTRLEQFDSRGMQWNVRVTEDEQRLFFLSDQSGYNALMMSPKSGEEFTSASPVQFSDPTFLRSGYVQNFEISPDGSVLVLHKLKSSWRPRMLVSRAISTTPLEFDAPRPSLFEGMEMWRESWPSEGVGHKGAIIGSGNQVWMPAISPGRLESHYLVFGATDGSLFRYARTPDIKYWDELPRLRSADGSTRFWYEGGFIHAAAGTLPEPSIYLEFSGLELYENFAFGAIYESPDSQVDLGTLSRDGKRLYFAGNRSDSIQDYDLYVATLEHDEFDRGPVVDHLMGRSVVNLTLFDHNGDRLLDVADTLQPSDN